jgi:hypothetical protein
MPLAMAILSGAFAREEARAGAGHLQQRDRICPHYRSCHRRFHHRESGMAMIFWINLPIGMIAIALRLVCLRESFGRRRHWMSWG